VLSSLLNQALTSLAQSITGMSAPAAAKPKHDAAYWMVVAAVSIESGGVLDRSLQRRVKGFI